MEAKSRWKFECVDLYILDVDTYTYSDRCAAHLILFEKYSMYTFFTFTNEKSPNSHVYLYFPAYKRAQSKLIKKLIITSAFKTLFCFVFYSISKLRHQNTSNCGCKCVKRLCKTFCGQSACLSGLTQLGWSLSEDWFEFV